MEWCFTLITFGHRAFSKHKAAYTYEVALYSHAIAVHATQHIWCIYVSEIVYALVLLFLQSTKIFAGFWFAVWAVAKNQKKPCSQKQTNTDQKKEKKKTVLFMDFVWRGNLIEFTRCYIDTWI